MQFKKLSAPSLKELFVEELENKILSGELSIGEKLPSERELATSMQVSRAVVNAGIAELEQKGFLEIRPRVGTFVNDYHRNGSLDTLVSIMKYNGGALSNEEVQSILELRIALVNMASSLAIDKASREEMQILVDVLDDIKASPNAEALVENTFHLYHELAFISGNSLLPLLFTSFKALVCALWHRYVLNYGMDALKNSSEEFVKLIIAGDKDAAKNYVESTTTESINGSKTIFHTHP
ncbi:MAG: GntR family transcriptional regulator [Lachnospiraceae bacterium]|nr:GntR family transcriptional regulator [Lachnospiraceae bacterium]